MTLGSAASTSLAPPGTYRAFVTTDPGWIRQAQRTRHIAFSADYGGQFASSIAGVDADRYDEFCEHVVIVDEASGVVAGTCRILSPAGAAAAGGRFAEQHFDLSGLTAVDPALMSEVGRTCIHPDHRNGSTISCLWAELGRHTMQSGSRWLTGCVSVPLADGGRRAAAIWSTVAQTYLSPAEYRVRPLLPWHGSTPEPAGGRQQLPALLRFYFLLGARVCGEPGYDASFPCADLYVLIDLEEAGTRFLRRYHQPPRSS